VNGSALNGAAAKVFAVLMSASAAKLKRRAKERRAE